MNPYTNRESAVIRMGQAALAPKVPTQLLPAQSLQLHLTHPTAGECRESIWRLSFRAWGDTLSLPQYLEESAYLTSVPLAKDGRMTIWVLVDKASPPDHRPILCSCETFRKHALISDKDGNVIDSIVHGIASVYCNPAYRGRGYASRMMRELAKRLPSWQAEDMKCAGSVLYSDIGKTYYAKFGWHPFPNNTHIEVQPSIPTSPPKASQLLAGDLDQLCKQDEALSRAAIAHPSGGKIRMMLVPDIDHMLWHHKKAEFAADKLFGESPPVKGAIAGEPGNRIWVIWTHRYYGDPEKASSGNTLYILRLVLENQASANIFSPEGAWMPSDVGGLRLQADSLRCILQAAQAEAAEWKLQRLELWDPTPLVLELLERTGISHELVVREDADIASLCWFGEGSGKEDMLEWVANERFAWC